MWNPAFHNALHRSEKKQIVLTTPSESHQKKLDQEKPIWGQPRFIQHNRSFSCFFNYFGSKDYDHPFQRLFWACQTGLFASSLVALTCVPAYCRRVPLPRAEYYLIAAKILWYGTSAMAAHSAVTSFLGTVAGKRDLGRHHFLAGIVAGAIIAIPRPGGYGAVFSNSSLFAVVSLFLKQHFQDGVLKYDQLNIPTNTGISNRRRYIGLDTRYNGIDPKHEETLERYL